MDVVLEELDATELVASLEPDEPLEVTPRSVISLLKADCSDDTSELVDEPVDAALSLLVELPLSCSISELSLPSRPPPP